MTSRGGTDEPSRTRNLGFYHDSAACLLRDGEIVAAAQEERFTRFSVGSVLGTIFLVHQAGAALGAWLGGFFFEVTGGYGAAFTIACVQLLAAAIVSLAADARPCAAARLIPVAGGR